MAFAHTPAFYTYRLGHTHRHTKCVKKNVNFIKDFVPLCSNASSKYSEAAAAYPRLCHNKVDLRLMRSHARDELTNLLLCQVDRHIVTVLYRAETVEGLKIWGD